ncbi:radical SAM protein [Marichromatium sp. AB31]|uniref:B12-binding domain-containing radical SAM protein n=1 Tax=Marichromatium sp. AB31 TaxID=2483362 RepID=UPI000F3EC4E0|nr:radical SAM protein [Marichromatium sp. AB31]RNE88437.1 radical SAM protein [Marichromatium sp. AB31]
MKLTLITPTPPDISAFDVRALSAHVRACGHQCRLIFLPGSIGRLRADREVIYHYPPEVLDDLATLSADADLIGLSFMTQYFDRALQVTEHLRRVHDAPLVWGGVHPSSRPDEALEHADMVVIGEGEHTLVELLECLARGADHRRVRGLWVREGEQRHRNPQRPLIDDLDSLPPFDFSNDDHYVLDPRAGRLRPLTDALLREILPLLPGPSGTLRRAFRTMTDRGCPHRCTYCSVSAIKARCAEDGVPYLRFRGVERVIAELVAVRERFPFVEAFQFFDDTFFARPRAQIEDFAARYRERVGLPFYVQASPSTLNERKLLALLDAGLVYVEFGIQSGSERIKRLYDRTESNERVVAAAELLHRHRDRLLPPDYHVITDNPWETEADAMDTVRLLYRLPKPFGLAVSNLVFYPHTPLYDRAVAEGLLTDTGPALYRKPFFAPRRTYPNFLLHLFTFQHVPRWVYRVLISERAVRLFSRPALLAPLGLVTRVGEGLRLLAKGGGALARGDWWRIARYLQRLRPVDPGVTGRRH